VWGESENARENLATRINGARLAGVADVNLAAAQDVAGQFHVPLATARLSSVARRTDIDAIAICSATDTARANHPGRRRARETHLCEKPIDLDLSACSKPSTPSWMIRACVSVAEQIAMASISGASSN